MVLSALSFLAGIIILQQLPVLPDPLWFIVGIILLPVCYLIRWFRVLAWVLAGLLWAWLHAWMLYQHSLPAEIEGQDFQVVGEVLSLPEKVSHRTRFLFRVQQANPVGGITWKKPGLIRLSWYGRHATLKPGQRWQLTVRLKRPNGFRNPAGFDYEGWLFQQGINASGYVRKHPGNKLIGQSWNLQTIRYAVYHLLHESLQGLDNRGLIMALALGIRTDISLPQWDVLQRTGTSHLIAISGLHIGLVAGLCFFLGRSLWRLAPSLCLWLPAPKAAAIMAMAGALLYAFLAGLAIPTQRALAMVTVVMYSILTDRTGKPSQTLSLALFCVLLIAPASVLSPGFWLSFSAVAVLLYAMTGRYGVFKGWRHWGRAQWIVSIGLLPLTLFIFQKASLVAPLANLIAIPWVSLLVVPLVLLGTLMLFVFKSGGEILLQWADFLLSPLQMLMHWLSDYSYSQWVQAAPSVPVMLLAGVAILLLLAPSGLPVKRIGILFLLPLFLLRADTIPSAGLRFTVLDVGQGLAVVVETQHHVLVYDVGPKFSDRFDTGSSVVMPYLRQQGHKQVDTMVISHGDNDHRGGFESVNKQISIKQLYTGAPEKLKKYNPIACEQSIQWQWDGVTFSFLHPDKPGYYKKNDRSCVLRIDAPGGSILLTGDIHKRSERRLLSDQHDALAADILVAPHHGSKTSSHAAFIKAVAAKHVIFTSGYRNHFKHPNKLVLQRYISTGSQLYDSARHGAIQFMITRQQGVSLPLTYRQHLSRHWSRD